MSNEQRIDSPFKVPVCDFCLTPGPRWSYDPKDASLAATTVEVPGRGTGVYFPGASAWAACTRCSTIFDRGDLATLARVCAESADRRLRALGYPPADIARDTERLLALHSELKAGLGPRRLASKAELRSSPGATIQEGRRQNVEGN